MQAFTEVFEIVFYPFRRCLPAALKVPQLLFCCLALILSSLFSFQGAGRTPHNQLTPVVLRPLCFAESSLEDSLPSGNELLNSNQPSIHVPHSRPPSEAQQSGFARIEEDGAN